MIGTFLMFTACGGDGSSTESNNEPINDTDIENRDGSQAVDHDNNEPQPPKDIMKTVTDALKSALDESQVNTADIEASSDPYEDPNTDPYNDTTL